MKKITSLLIMLSFLSCKESDRIELVKEKIKKRVDSENNISDYTITENKVEYKDVLNSLSKKYMKDYNIYENTNPSMASVYLEKIDSLQKLNVKYKDKMFYKIDATKNDSKVLHYIYDENDKLFGFYTE